MIEFKRTPKIVQWFYKQAIWKSPDDSVWLTFDDGPDPLYTRKYLDLLNSLNYKAIFFIVGSKADDENLINDIINSGHDIGWHGQEHIHFAKLSRDELLEQFRMKEKFEDKYNIQIKYFRFPYGSFRSYMIRIADAFEMDTVFWTYMVHDYKNKSSEKLLSDLRKVRASDVLLYHDSSKNSKEAYIALETFLKTSTLRFRRIKGK
jgi:peptidoglycan-N-acetylglucosamine deacetylase